MNKDRNILRYTQGKRQIASPDGCLSDLKAYCKKLFQSFFEAVKETNNVLSQNFSPIDMSRSFEASLFQTCLAKQLRKNFPNEFKMGRYKRLILHLPDYLFLFKKLNNKGMPMNIKTGSVDAISNQLSLNLFEDAIYEPILFLGYQKNKIGKYINPQIVYIDDGKIQFTLTEGDFENVRELKPIEEVPVIETTVSPTIKKSVKKRNAS